MSPEDRVTKSMELQEDITKKSGNTRLSLVNTLNTRLSLVNILEFTKKLEQEKEDIFPKPGEKVPSDAKKFIERLKTVRNTLNALEEEASGECTKFSEDVKHWAEFQTGVKVIQRYFHFRSLILQQ